MSDAAHSDDKPVAKKKKGKLPLIIVAVLALGGGAATPMVAPGLLGKGKDQAKAKPPGEVKTATIPFAEAVVNLAEDRMTRYLKVKIVLLVEAEYEKEATEKVTKQKAVMKSWMLSHLAGKTVKDVSGTVGVNRIQRELLEKFEDILYPDGHGHLKNVLFEEYVVQ